MTDKELIKRLGGVVAVSGYLGVSYQCVFNWLTRGIPSRVKVNNKEIFLSEDPKPLPVAEQTEQTEHA